MNWMANPYSGGGGNANNILAPIDVTGSMLGNGNVPSTGQMVAMGNNVPASTAQLMMGAGGTGNGFMDSLSNAWNQNPLGTIGTGLNAFQSLAGIYSTFKALNLAKKNSERNWKLGKTGFNNDVTAYHNEKKDQYAANASAASVRGKQYQSFADWNQGRDLQRIG